MLQTAAPTTSRRARELSRIRLREAVSQPARRADEIVADLLAQPSDEDLDRIGVAVEILLVQMFDQFRAGYDPAAVVGEVGEEPVFRPGPAALLAVDGHLSRARILSAR